MSKKSVIEKKEEKEQVSFFRKVKNYFSYFKWYVQPGTTLIVTIPMLLSVIYFTFMAILNGILGFLAMTSFNIMIMILTGMALIFPACPLLFVAIYSRVPMVFEEKIIDVKMPNISKFGRYALITVVMIVAILIMIAFFYAYNYVLEGSLGIN